MLSNNDILKIREQFPILSSKVNGRQLVYLDNAATTQKPLSVINKLYDYYTSENSNIHRGVHSLSIVATEMHEECRRKIAQFINAPDSSQIIFTRGTTESINLIATGFGKRFVEEGDEVLISALEHHSNIVPWQIMCQDRKAVLKVIPINEKGDIEIDKIEDLISSKTKIIAVSHVSNALGTVNPIEKIISIAHNHNIPVLIDGAQGIPHTSIDVQKLDCDFYCFSGHKMYAPMGIGVLYGKADLLNEIPPYQGGGEMIKRVTFDISSYNDIPFKFEAGTPSVGDAIALSSALDFMNSIGLDKIEEYEQMLMVEATKKLENLGFVRIIGTSDHKAGVISFVIDNIHPYDIGVILDKQGIAVRTGHHCAEPVINFYNVPGTVRVSFAIYNTMEEIDIFIEALKKTYEMLKL